MPDPADPRASRNYLVFVSHHGSDTWVARQIAQAIHATGADAFLDEAQIQIGARFEEEIRNSLEHANELFVLLTPWALQRPYVLTELGAAWIRRIPVAAALLGVTVQELQSRTEIPLILKERNAIDLNEIDT